MVTTGNTLAAGGLGKPVAAKPAGPPSRPNPEQLASLPNIDAVAVTDGVGAVAFKDGKPVDANGNPVNDHPSLLSRLSNSLIPDRSTVSDDYGKYQKWQFVYNTGNNALSYLALTATAAGLVAASAMNIPVLALLGAGTAALALKSGFNWAGTLLGNSKGRAIDDDPAKWTANSGVVQAVAQAIQSITLAVPGGYFALVPATNAVQQYGEQTDSLSKQLISLHQAKDGSVGYVTAKNNNQDLVSGLVGTGIGLGASLALVAVAPWAPVLVAPVLAAVTIFAALKRGSALTLDNLTNSVVRGLAHAEITTDTVPTPAEMKADKASRKVISKQDRIILGADPQWFTEQPERLKELADIFGDRKFVMDVGETHGPLGLGKKPCINVGMVFGSGTEDQVQAEYTAQILSDILTSPGYAAMAKTMGDPKAATLQAIKLAVGASGNFEQTLKDAAAKGWSLNRTVLGAGTGTLIAKGSGTPAQVPTVTPDALQAFMKTGQLPGPSAPAPGSGPSTNPS